MNGPFIGGYSAADMAAQGAEQFRAGQASMLAAGERKPLHAVEAMRLVLNVDMHTNHIRGTTNWAVAITRAIERAHGIAAQQGDKS